VDLDLLSGQLQVAQLYEAAPASLRKKIRINLRPVAPTPAPSSLLSWRWVAAAALLLVAFVVWRVIPAFHGEEDYQARFATGIVDAHLRSLLPGQITNVNSNDPQTVRAWFEGKVKFAFLVRDFADYGFSLRGGRVDVVQGRTVATLVYASGEHLVNVFIWPTRQQDADPLAGSRQGYPMHPPRTFSSSSGFSRISHTNEHVKQCSHGRQKLSLHLATQLIPLPHLAHQLWTLDALQAKMCLSNVRSATIQRTETLAIPSAALAPDPIEKLSTPA
jgi:anti-sigma factor RsiW